MPEGKSHDVDRSYSKRWSKASICAIGNYFYDNPITQQSGTHTIYIETDLK